MCPRNIRPNCILVITSNATNSSKSISACPCSSNNETASYIGLEDFLRLRFVNDRVYGVWIVPFFPDNLLQDVGSSREETPGRRLPLLYG